jgi:hypothetical protein
VQTTSCMFKTAVRLCVAWALFSCFPIAGFSAQVVQRVYVFAEDDDKDSVMCQARNDSVIASLEAALRYNRIQPSSNRSEEVRAYINNNIIYVKEIDYCVFNQTIAFLKYAPIRINQSNKTIFGQQHICNRSYVGIFRPNRIQSTLSQNAKAFVDECISEIEREAK